MSITEVQHQQAAFFSGYGAVKRLFDITAAASLLALLAPVLLIIALAVKLETRGPALFRQARCGAGSLSFTALKFRTMHVDAEARLMEMLAVNTELKLEYDRHHKLQNDPRVTRFGRFLRRTSLDELPQLWNVLIGDMSLIGPRPYMPHELAPHPLAQSQDSPGEAWYHRSVAGIRPPSHHIRGSAPVRHRLCRGLFASAGHGHSAADGDGGPQG